MTSRDREHDYLRTTFLERMAHELRGPAGAIHGALHELEAALGEDAPKHAALLSIARRGVQRIVRQADRLQQTAELERGGVAMRCANCDLSELVRTTMQQAQSLENRRAITVKVHAPERPTIVSIDARWVAIALYELAANAIRHASSLVEVDVCDDAEQVEVVIRDDNREQADFGPSRFRQTREQRGLGLSLSIVRDVADAHGGALRIAPRPSTEAPSGAEVRLVLPRQAAARSTHAAAQL